MMPAESTVAAREEEQGAEEARGHHWPLHAAFTADGAVEALRRDGFHRFGHFLADEYLPELRAAYDDRLHNCRCPRKELDVACRWDDPLAAPFMRAILDERLLDFLARVCGLPFVAVSMDFFGKAPHSETEIPWHQDTYTSITGFKWTEERASDPELPHPVTLWVAVDAVSAANGGMEFVAGRHRELLYMKHSSRSKVPDEEIQDDERVDYCLQAGQAGIHHPLAPHRSCPNVTDRHRRVFSFQFVPWTEKAEQLCAAPADLQSRAAQRGWQSWRSEPSGRYAFVPGNEQCFAEKHVLKRLLVCCQPSH